MTFKFKDDYVSLFNSLNTLFKILFRFKYKKLLDFKTLENKKLKTLIRLENLILRNPNRKFQNEIVSKSF